VAARRAIDALISDGLSRDEIANLFKHTLALEACKADRHD
jgi:hypothetical protein